MKKTGQRWHLRDQHTLNAFTEWVQGQWKAGNKPTVQMMKADRTSNQNTMAFALYRDIANQVEDQSIVEVRRECKLRYGVVIRKGADPEWAQWYDRAIKPMRHEDKLLLMDDYPVTSEFTKEQFTEYLGMILKDYGQRGVSLIDPRMAYGT